jgi:hypothetical protein
MDETKQKNIKWFFFDLGNNYFIDYIDFQSKVIRLKDDKEYFMINFRLYDNINYKTKVSDLINFTSEKYNIELSQMNNYDINKLFEPKNLYDYFVANILDMILEDLNSRIENNVDILENILKIKTQIVTIPVFESSNTKYVCICNFNRFLSKCLSLIKPIKDDKLPLVHLICLSPGIKEYGITSINGYSFNLMKTLWYKLENQSALLLHEYTIDKMKINLGSFIYSIQNKFPDFYIIFNSSKAPFDTRSSRFITYFKLGDRKKSKMAKRINKYKNLENVMLKKYEKKQADAVSELINLDRLSLNEKQKKKITKKCITTDYNSIPSTGEQIDNRKEEVHTICKYFTGSKHCYYSGYKEMLKDFDGFCLNQNKAHRDFRPIDNSNSSDISGFNDDGGCADGNSAMEL